VSALADYLAVDVRTATPAALVSRLLARLVACAQEARALEAGAARTRLLTRALDILAELRRALDFSQSAEIAGRLERLYEFAADRLLSAASTRERAAIDEALAALVPIAEAFASVAAAPGEATAP
jgi:flagellar biosynthetic protein FliS